MSRDLRLGPIAAAFAGVALVSCAAPGAPPASAGRTLVVFAAASLAGPFDQIARDFERQQPGLSVQLGFGPSNGLATQILEGAPVDVFASASPRPMDAVAAGPGVSGRADMATNALVVVAPADDPGAVESLADLARPGLRLVVAAEGVPAGDYARQVLDAAGIRPAAEANVVSNEVDVRGVLQKVLAGEADAGLVYRTDVTPAVASRLAVVEVPEAHRAVAVYPIGVVGGAPEPELARAFVAHVLGPGQAALRAAGLRPPP